MGVIYTQNLNQNEQRAFPLDERSRRVSDNSLELPDNLIVALNIRFPDTAGQFVALSSVIVTDNLVSLTFVATDWTPFGSSSSANLNDFVPLAVISLVKPVVKFKAYSLTSLYPGAGGWIVFGSGINANTKLLFSNPADALVLPTCAKPVSGLPVTELVKDTTSLALSGTVLLKAGPDLQINGTDLTVEGQIVRAIEISASSQNQADILKKYTGACFKTATNLDCPLLPISNINNVYPDCAGNINLIFQGDVSPAIDTALATIILDTPITLSQMCPNTAPPTASDLCSSSEVWSAYPEFSSSLIPIPVQPPNLDICLLCEQFADITNWHAVSGTWTTVDISGNNWYDCKNSVNGQLISVLEPYSQSLNAGSSLNCYNEAISQLYVKMNVLPDGNSANGWLVFNYESPSNYCVAGLDLNNQLAIFGQMINARFREVTTQPYTCYVNTNYELNLVFTPVGSEFDITLFINGSPILTSSLNYQAGLVGLGGNSSHVQFHMFTDSSALCEEV